MFTPQTVTSYQPGDARANDLRVCIVIPVFNEESTIERNVEEILAYAVKLPAQASLVAVNDGSRDRTSAILASLATRHAPDRFHAISYAQNRGYGGAIKTGARYAIERGHEYIVFMDSDLTDHPQYLLPLVQRMQEGWDYIKTTRHVSMGGYQDVPWKRRVISRVGCTIARGMIGLPLTDLANGFRAIRTSIFSQLQLREDGFAIIMEELGQVRRITRRCCEIPRVQGVRDADARPSTFTYDPKTFWRYLKYLVRL